MLLYIRLTPGAGQEKLVGIWADDKSGVWLSASVRAVPDKGKANAALVKLLARRLDIPAGTISLEMGDTNRLKRLRISGQNAGRISQDLDII